jgi:hypothetical protein
MQNEETSAERREKALGEAMLLVGRRKPAGLLVLNHLGYRGSECAAPQEPSPLGASLDRRKSEDEQAGIRALFTQTLPADGPRLL